MCSYIRNSPSKIRNYLRNSSIDSANSFPAANALTTSEAPDTTSPAAKTLSCLVFPLSSVFIFPLESYS